MTIRWDHYWIWTPLASMTFSKCSGIDLCRFLMVSLLNFFAHISWAQINSFWSLYCLSLYRISSIRCNTFAMIFRSGLYLGLVKTAILFNFRYCSTFFAVWILSLFCCQIHLFWPNCPWHYRIKMVCKSRYFRLLYLPSVTFVTKLQALEMAPIIIQL